MNTTLERTDKRHNIYLILAGLCLAVCIGVFLMPGKVWAANASFGWSTVVNVDSTTIYPSKTSVTVEVGQSFYLSDYICLKKSSGSFINVSELSIKYVSSKPSVVSVNKKTGAVKTKKKGTAKITATYKGKKLVCTMKVVAKGKLKSTTTYKKLNQYSKALAAYRGKKITSKNICNILKALSKWRGEYLAKKMDDVTLKDNAVKWRVPLSPACWGVYADVEEYVDSHYPLNKYGNQSIQIRSMKASAASNTVTVTLTKKITKQQIYLLQYIQQHESYVKKYNDKTAVYDASAEWDYLFCVESGGSTYTFGKVTFTKGSNQAVVKLYTKDGKRYQLKKGDTVSSVDDLKIIQFWGSEMSVEVQ